MSVCLPLAVQTQPRAGSYGWHGDLTLLFSSLEPSALILHSTCHKVSTVYLFVHLLV